MKTARLANVVVRRLEERAPGEGVPAGWMPEIVYHLTATEIPYNPTKLDYTISLRPRGLFILRRLAVSPLSADEWDLSVAIGRSLVCPRSSGCAFGEDPCWPPAAEPLTLRPGEDAILTLWRRGLAIATKFECILRGAEERPKS